MPGSELESGCRKRRGTVEPIGERRKRGDPPSLRRKAVSAFRTGHALPPDAFSPRACPRARGSNRVKVVRPGTLSFRNRSPFWARASNRLMGKPNPIPRVFSCFFFPR